MQPVRGGLRSGLLLYPVAAADGGIRGLRCGAGKARTVRTSGGAGVLSPDGEGGGEARAGHCAGEAASAYDVRQHGLRADLRAGGAVGADAAGGSAPVDRLRDEQRPVREAGKALCRTGKRPCSGACDEYARHDAGQRPAADEAGRPEHHGGGGQRPADGADRRGGRVRGTQSGLLPRTWRGRDSGYARGACGDGADALGAAGAAGGHVCGGKNRRDADAGGDYL